MKNIKTHKETADTDTCWTTDDRWDSPKNTVHKLFRTGQEDVPKEASQGGLAIEKNFLKTKHEEADPIAVALVMYIAKEEAKSVSVVANDTDI